MYSMTKCGNSGIKSVYNYKKTDFVNTKWSNKYNWEYLIRAFDLICH